MFIVTLALITKPMGLYLMRVLAVNGRTWLDPVLRPLERGTYRLMGVDSERKQDWKHQNKSSGGSAKSKPTGIWSP